MYLNYDIMKCILDKINNFDEKINFCKVNKELYSSNYKKIMKKKIKEYIYKDYTIFFRFLNRFNYNENELNELLRYTLINFSLPTIWIDRTNGLYDLRFLFEIFLLNNNILQDKEIEKLHNTFYNTFYFPLKNAIVINNRKESKLNLQKISFLKTLHNNIHPYRKKNKESINFKKIY